jgi:hypothetical protein
LSIPTKTAHATTFEANVGDFEHDGGDGGRHGPSYLRWAKSLDLSAFVADEQGASWLNEH